MMVSDSFGWHCSWNWEPWVPCTQWSGHMTCSTPLGRMIGWNRVLPGLFDWNEQWFCGCQSRVK